MLCSSHPRTPGSQRPLEFLTPQKLDCNPNEFMLIHGTTPKPLYGILFEGLDPALSKKGLFGNGTYLAEDALLRMLHSMRAFL